MRVVCIDGSTEVVSMEYENSTYLGVLNNSSNEFKFKIQMFPIVMQVQGASNVLRKFYALVRSITNYKLTISKIIFNSR